MSHINPYQSPEANNTVDSEHWGRGRGENPAKSALRDAVLIFVLSMVVGFVLGVAGGSLGVSTEVFLLMIAGGNLLSCTVGFAIAGARHPRKRWDHLARVVSWLWPMGLLNLFFGVSILQWFTGIFFLLITMGLGGVVSYLFARPQTAGD
jgi:hypothetical protein